MDELDEEVRAGRTRFRGISSHHPDVLRAALDDGRCDVLMFPVGPFVDLRYVEEILPRAKASGVGTVCFKTFGAGKLLGDTEGYQRPLSARPRGKLSSGGASDGEAALPRLSVAECLRYSLTLDPDVALLGLSFPNEQDAAFAAARAFAPFSDREMADLRERAAIAIRRKYRSTVGMKSWGTAVIDSNRDAPGAIATPWIVATSPDRNGKSDSSGKRTSAASSTGCGR